MASLSSTIGTKNKAARQRLIPAANPFTLPPVFSNAIHGEQMEIALRKYGNSTVAVLPPSVLKDLGLSAGQLMTLSTTGDGKVVLARKHKYTLADLLAQCDLKAPPPADLAPWDATKPVGGEVW